MPTLPRLFEPIKVGSLVLPNRIIMPAVTTNYGAEGDERQANFYAEIARGGVALIIIGACVRPGRVARAVAGGFQAALEI
ncbi:MAG: hypothetical protein HY668_01465 [Chloroflexi bacterium]|nr:hypothetical protein [Chloroflexota bacterium]